MSQADTPQPDSSDAPMEQHKARLRAAGYKVTQARLAVLHVLHEHHAHLTSAEVIDAVADVDDSIGRASVFRTLDLLTQLGIVRPTYIGSSITPRYVMMPGGHHHHIICTRCQRVIEFEDCGLGHLQQQLEQAYDLRITGHLLEFYAVCDACARQDDETA